MAQTKQKNFILLPASTLAATDEISPSATNFLTNLASHQPQIGIRASVSRSVRVSTQMQRPGMDLKVIDSIHENGAKLVSISTDQVSQLRFSQPGLRIIPEVFYKKSLFMPMINKGGSGRKASVGKKSTRTSAAKKVSMKFVSEENGEPLKGLIVVAFTDFKNRVGADGKTNAAGVVKLSLRGTKIQRLYVYTDHTYWPLLKKNVAITTKEKTYKLPTIDLKFKDSLRHFYQSKTQPDYSSIKVGVIDTGSGPHRCLNIQGGENTVQGEHRDEYHDNGDMHGTHVAGIIGAQGDLNGVAPGVPIYSYRVFPKNDDASNFAIMKAIDRAVADGCDLINMSLGMDGSVSDEGIMSAIKDAFSKGTICFAATGNEERDPVNFPAAYSLTVAVSAIGRKGTYPKGTEPVGSEARPYGKDKKNYIADFSNVGEQVDLTAPGVGIISTIPGDLFGVMSGTSMACPAATGMAARLLAQEKNILKMPRNQKRSEAIMQFLAKNLSSMGFAPTFEGNGMLK